MSQVVYYTPDSEIKTECASEALALLLGKKWVPRIIEILSQGPQRFGQLHKELDGASPKMLKQQLALLEANGLIINHKESQANQVSSTYCLTDTGQSLVAIISAMKVWGSQHLQCDHS